MIPLLKGLRILDLTSVILGPYATQILGDLGAEVIKVEPPEGDSMRPVAPVAAPGLSAIFANFNRNKRSVVLDLKSEAGKAALRKLMPTADVFVHNMRQEAMDKLGFTFKAVREVNPRIIYAAAIGFGRHGRYAGKPAYDDVIQAASGFAGLFQMRDGAPLYAPSIAADKVSGLHLAYAVMAALLYRERTGEVPGYVEVPMFELMAAFSLSRAHERGHVRGGRQGRLRARHLAVAAALQDQGRLGRRAALYAAQLDQDPRRDRPCRRRRAATGSRMRPSAAAASTSSTTCWPSPWSIARRPSGSPPSSGSTFPPSPSACRTTCCTTRTCTTSGSSRRTLPARRR